MTSNDIRLLSKMGELQSGLIERVSLFIAKVLVVRSGGGTF
jgi:hypothetical protein